MIPASGFHVYSESENERLAKKSQDFIEIFKEAKDKIDKRSLVKLKEENPDNSIWIDPSIKVEFERLKDTKMEVHEIFEIYEKWFEQLYKLTVINEPRLHKKTMRKHIVDLMVICGTFQEFLKQTLAMSDPTASMPSPRRPKPPGPFRPKSA